MERKSIKKNYIYNLIQQLLTLLAPLITAPYISRVLGAEGIGVYSYASSMVSYFTLIAALGTASYGQREVSYVQDDRKKRTEVFWNTEILCCITTLISLILYTCFIIFQKQNRMVFIVLALSVVDVCFNITWLLSGMEEFGKIVLRNIIIKIFSIAFIFLFVHKKTDLIIYVIGLTLATVLSDVSLWPFIPKFVDKPSLKDLHPFKDIKVVLSLFIPTIAISIYTVLDKTMIGLITHSPAENGFYEQAIKISRVALAVVTSLGVVMVPRIGFHYGKHDTELVQQYMYRSYRFVWFLGIPICFGLIGISSNMVPWFYGNGFERVIPLLKVLSFLVLAIGINNVTGIQYLIPTKRQNIFTQTVLVGAVVNFISNLFLIHFFGCVGAAVASVFAETVIAVVQLIIIRKELSWIEIIKNSCKYFVSGVVMLACVLIESAIFNPSILNTLIMILTGVTVYVLMLILLRDSFFINNINIILVKLHIKNKES